MRKTSPLTTKNIKMEPLKEVSSERLDEGNISRRKSPK